MQKSAATRPARRSSRVLEHTLQGFTEALERALFAEEMTARPGLLQALDPRVKVISVLALLVGASLSRSLAVIAAIYLLALVLAIASAIPAGFFVKRVWLALPFFTGMIALPALFITPGPALLHLLSPEAASLREFALVPLGFAAVGGPSGIAQVLDAAKLTLGRPVNSQRAIRAR